MSDTDVVQGALKLQGVLENFCFEDAADLVRQLPKLLAVEVPATVSNVVIGVQQPGADKTNNLWIRLDNSGDFVGIYVYAQGQWRQVTPVPNQVFQLYGNSEEVPAGYTLAQNSSALSTAQKEFLAGQSHWHNNEPDTYWDIYFAVYTGY